MLVCNINLNHIIFLSEHCSGEQNVLIVNLETVAYPAVALIKIILEEVCLYIKPIWEIIKIDVSQFCTGKTLKLMELK